MTNEYGSDSQPPQEHEHEAPEQEPAAHEGEASVWTDDQPPHDDFGGGTEEMATVSQEAATDGEADESAAPETRNSRSMLPIFAGIGGILLLGAVIYWQFGRSPQAPAPMPALAASTRAPASPAALPPTAMPPTSASTNSAETDINALYKPSAGSSPAAASSSDTTEIPPPAAMAGPSSTSSPPSPTETASPPSPTTAMATVPEATVRPAAGTPAASIPPMPQLQAGQANPVPPMPGHFRAPPVNPSIVSPGANVSGSDPQQAVRINALTMRIEELQKSLEQENKQLSQVSNMVAANQVPVAAATSHANANPDLENRLNRIEQTLLKLENDESSKVSTSPAIEIPHAATKTHLSRTISTKHKYTHKKSKIVHRKPSSFRPPYEMADSGRSSWVLRAATPKEAWVSADPTSSELRHVQVGDSLAGVGTVRAIRQSGGGWEIEGTTGTVR